MRSALRARNKLLLRAVGLARQEQLEVLGKAVKICLECIGIG